jgi:hypothetical protein
LENTSAIPSPVESRISFPDELIKLLKYLALIVNQKFRKAHHVHEQDVGNFQMKFLFNLGGHPLKLHEKQSNCNSPSRRPSRAKLPLFRAPTAPGSPTQLPAEITSAMSQCDRTIFTTLY